MSRSIFHWTVLVVALGAALGWAAESNSREDIDEARTALQEWVRTKGIISSEQQQWQLGREMLFEQVRLAEDEIASYREKIAGIQANITEADSERAKLMEENEALKASSDALAEIIGSLESKTISLERRLPDEARDRIKVLSQQLPEDPRDTKLSLSQRYLNELGVLDMLNKFDRTIEVTSERRQLPDGSAAEVSAMYVGLGQTYYTGAGATVGGIGRPGPEGWRWESANDAADDVAKAIAIWNNEEVAGFVSLPVTVEQGTPNAQ